MAQRNSRTGKKNPDLRTGGGRKAKSQRSEARKVQAERSAPAGPPNRVRPAGPGGVAFMLAIAWGAIIGFAIVGWVLGRWNVMSYPDSLWMYVAFGTLAVAPAVGRVSRKELDADAWGAQALLVPAALLVVDALLGPSCPTGGDCAAIGARGALGLVWSIVLIAVLALGAWGFARWQYRVALAKRPTHGRVRYGIAAMTMLGMLLFPGLVLAAGTLGADTWLRDTPALVVKAADEVERDCFGLVDAPELAVRAAPDGYNPDWTTFAVRRADEDRPGVLPDAKPADPKDADSKDAKDKADAKDAKPKQPKPDPLPSNWAELGYVHPYEATVSFNQDGDLVGVTCRRVGPDTGNAVADDLEQAEPDSNPLSPKSIGSQFLPRFFTQGVAGPTEEGKKKAAEEAKQAAADKKKAAAKDKADSTDDDSTDDDSKDADSTDDATK